MRASGAARPRTGRCCRRRTTWAGRPGAAGAGGHRRAGGGHPARGRRRSDRRALLRDEKVDGTVIRGALPAGWAEAAGERRGVADVLIDTWPTCTPSTRTRSDVRYGRPSAWGSGRLRRWSDQWERSKSREVPAVDELARLLRAEPPRGRGSDRARGTSGSTTPCWASRCRRRCRPCWTGSCPPWGSRWPTSACSCSSWARAN